MDPLLGADFWLASFMEVTSVLPVIRA